MKVSTIAIAAFLALFAPSTQASSSGLFLKVIADDGESPFAACEAYTDVIAQVYSMTEKAVFDEPNDRALQDSLDMIVVEPNDENNNDRNLLLRGDRNLARGSFCTERCRNWMPGQCHLVWKRCWPSKCDVSIHSNDGTFNPTDPLLTANALLLSSFLLFIP